MNHNGGFVSQHAENDEETRALFESLLNNCRIEIENVKKVNRDVKAANVKLTAELESYKANVKAFEFHNKRLSELETGYQNSVSREKQLQLKFDTLDVNSFKKITSLNAEISDLQNQLSKQKTAYANL